MQVYSIGKQLLLARIKLSTLVKQEAVAARASRQLNRKVWLRYAHMLLMVGLLRLSLIERLANSVAVSSHAGFQVSREHCEA